jgi:hypothetical protein
VLTRGDENMAVVQSSSQESVVVPLRRHGAVKPVGPVNPWRVVLGCLGVLLFAAAVCALVRVLDGVPGHAPLAFVLGLVLIPVVAAPIEWIVHRYVYHQPVVPPLRPIFTVHTAHHYAFFPTWRYVTGGPARRLAIKKRAPDAHREPLRNARVRLAHFAWYMGIGVIVVWTPAWFATHDAWFLAGLVVGSAIVSNLFIVVHDTIHRPGSHRFVEAQPWYPFLDRHHYIHHIDLGANLNFLLPLGDLMFGTLRTQLTPQELAGHGTLEQAKALPVGEGERVRSIPD